MSSAIVTGESLRPDEIVKLADSRLLASINEALAAVPEGQHLAVIATAGTEDVRGVVAFRGDEHWSVVGIVTKEYKGDYHAQIAVKVSL